MKVQTNVYSLNPERIDVPHGAEILTAAILVKKLGGTASITQAEGAALLESGEQMHVTHQEDGTMLLEVK